MNYSYNSIDDVLVAKNNFNYLLRMGNSKDCFHIKHKLILMVEILNFEHY